MEVDRLVEDDDVDDDDDRAESLRHSSDIQDIFHIFIWLSYASVVEVNTSPYVLLSYYFLGERSALVRSELILIKGFSYHPSPIYMKLS